MSSGKEAAATDDDKDEDDSDIDAVGYKEVHKAFKLPPTIRGIQRTLDLLSCQLEVSAHEIVIILKDRNSTKAYMTHLLQVQQQMQDQAAAWGEHGEVEELVAGGCEWDESDGDDKDDEEDELDRPEFVQGSSRQ